MSARNSRRHTALALGVGVGLLAAAGVGVGLGRSGEEPTQPGPQPSASASASATETAEQKQARDQLDAALEAARAASSVDAQVSVVASTGPFTQSIQAIAHGGRQELSGLAGKVEVRVVEDVAFIKGDPVALQAYFGFSPGGALKSEGRWISYLPTSERYRLIAAATTLEMLTEQLRLEAPLRPGEGRSDNGVELHSIVGKPQGDAVPEDARATLWIETSTNLPHTLEVVGGGASYTIKLSKWNQPVSVEAPERPILVDNLAELPIIAGSSAASPSPKG